MVLTRDHLDLFVLTANPSDYPGKYVVRRQRVSAGQIVTSPDPEIVSDTIEQARAVIPPDMVNVGRQPGDDLVIVEVWI